MQYGIILSWDQPMSGLLSAQNSMKSPDKYGRNRYHPSGVVPSNVYFILQNGHLAQALAIGQERQQWVSSRPFLQHRN
jgi:hypothetical protein